MFEFGEDLLARIEVRAVGRQEDAVGASGADGLASRFALVAAKIVRTTISPGARVGANTFSTYSVKSSPLMGP